MQVNILWCESSMLVDSEVCSQTFTNLFGFEKKMKILMNN